MHSQQGDSRRREIQKQPWPFPIIPFCFLSLLNPDCDVQLFGPQGEIMNPIPSEVQKALVACRTFIDVAPRYRIAIHAIYVDLKAGANHTRSNYISVRTGRMAGVSALSTVVVIWAGNFYLAKSRVCRHQVSGIYCQVSGVYQLEPVAT